MAFLKDSNPELFSELVVADESLTTGSGRKVRWRCTSGHEWDAKVVSRVYGSGCPYCSGRRRIVGVNDLATLNPGLASELVDESLAKELAPNSLRKVSWRCSKGHVWEASPLSRTQGNGCPVCSGKLVVAGVNDLATTHPDIAAEAVDQDMVLRVGHGSGKRLAWRCSKGHVWEMPVVARTAQGQGCPYCSGVRLRSKHGLLSDERPDIARELVDAELSKTLTSGSNRYVDWRCSKGHVWRGTVANRVTNGQACPYCSGRKASVGHTDLATTHPDLADELVDKTLATELVAASSRKVMWRCKEGHEWISSVADRVRGSGCPYCAGKKVLVGFNDLATTDPDIASELVDARDAFAYTRGSHARLLWRCEHGHEWVAEVASRTINGSGCPYCANRAVSDENGLAKVRPDLADELVDDSLVDSLVVGSRRRVEWRCERGHHWFARVVDRAGVHATGCPVCVSMEGSSSGERSLADCVRVLVGDGVEVFVNDRAIIAPQELDVVVPSKHIAIEFNGVWWHSEEAGKGKRYHLEKRLACEAAGYQLIQVWEDVWRDRRDVVLRMLAAKLGCSSRLGELGLDARYSHRLFARKLGVRRVDGHAAREFLEKNHVQGAVSATRHLGLFSSDELVALLSIRSPNNNARMRRKVGEWEIQRYATACSVVGGFTRLLAHAERELRDEGVELSRWVSFSSCDVSDGHMYEACGFSRDAEIRPEYMYVGRITNWTRAPKESFQKRRFRDRDDLVFKEGLTERELAHMNGLLRCFDSGKIRWVRDVF